MTDWQTAARSEAPRAEFVTISGPSRAVIRCPYCDEHHEHGGVYVGALEHRTAACGLYFPISRGDRARGYTFTVPPRGDYR